MRGSGVVAAGTTEAVAPGRKILWGRT